NNLPELWAIVNFILPKIFDSVKSVDEWFSSPFSSSGGGGTGAPTTVAAASADELNEEERKTVVRCPISALQRRMTEWVKVRKVVGPFGEKRGSRTLSNLLMQLLKISNHPFVFPEVEVLFIATARAAGKDMQYSSADLIFRTSAKFELLDWTLPKFFATGHRAYFLPDDTGSHPRKAQQKLDLDGKVIQAGKFDNKTLEKERKELLRPLFDNEIEGAGTEGGEEADPELTEDQLNELERFTAMDVERKAAAGALPRLLGEDELQVTAKPPSDTEEREMKSRERKRIRYADNMSDDQWLSSLEDGSVDDAADEQPSSSRAARRELKCKRLDDDDEDDGDNDSGT
ncbi:RSC chromatin remodeling complex ATPase component, partial [Cladochytrium tenue]